eukprot:CAMPEP_0171673968 /NCGR_PEP_ID=MMETSP0990-20121206/52930_1 /TAXON_ID=483369 /ORGANISM="non described non described, Strain CCMP2098" /LENGTH=138 /DNA_ID=CAMNT_0012259609 /DNA_START=358 /DNA_END=771 /DNA_ORIENTATION=-
MSKAGMVTAVPPLKRFQTRREAVNVEKRQRGNEHLVGPIPEPPLPIFELEDVGDEVFVAEPGALGQAGGAARVRQHRHLVFPHRPQRRHHCTGSFQVVKRKHPAAAALATAQHEHLDFLLRFRGYELHRRKSVLQHLW